MTSEHPYTKPPRRREVTWAKVRRRALRSRKALMQRLGSRPDGRRVLLVVGCQRSGTDLVTEILDRDRRTRVFPEVSRLSSEDDPRRLRLRPIGEVKAEIGRTRAELVVAKPLVESQNVPELLDALRPARALWMFRDPRAVAASHVRKWGAGNSIRDLSEVVDGREGSWRSERVSDAVRETVARLFSPGMDGHDAAALWWYVRNSHFFGLGLDTDEDVALCRYESLIEDPAGVVAWIYRFAGLDDPPREAERAVHGEAVGRGSGVELSPDVARLCSDLLDRLAATWDAQAAGREVR